MIEDGLKIETWFLNPYDTLREVGDHRIQARQRPIEPGTFDLPRRFQSAI